MGRYTSIQAEVCAIGRCAEFNLKRNYHGKDIAILSDSQAAMKALSKTKITSKLVNEVRTALDKLGAVNKLTIRWVPGHNNIPGNELADNLARKGAENRLIGPEPFCGVGHHRLRGLLKSPEEEKRLSFWEHLPGLRQSKIRIRNIIILTGLLTGHCQLHSHLHKIGIADSKLCRFYCMEEESSAHIICDCMALSIRIL